MPLQTRELGDVTYRCPVIPRRIIVYNQFVTIPSLREWLPAHASVYGGYYFHWTCAVDQSVDLARVLGIVLGGLLGPPGLQLGFRCAHWD